MIILFLKLLIGWLLITIGVFFILSAIVGILRFPDFYTRLHASGVSDSFGIPVFLIGLSFLQPEFTSSIKLLLLAISMLIISPTATHALIKSAWLSKEQPLTGALDNNE